MPESVVFKPRNRLAKILSGTYGETPEELIAASEARLAALEGPLRDYVAAEVHQILRMMTWSETELRASIDTLAVTAMNVTEVAAAAGLRAIGAVARGICAMTEAHTLDGVWHFEALKLHIASLALLSHTPTANEEGDAQVLARLHDLRLTLNIAE